MSLQSMLFVVPIIVIAVAALFYYLAQHYDMDKSLMVFKICTGFAQVRARILGVISLRCVSSDNVQWYLMMWF